MPKRYWADPCQPWSLSKASSAWNADTMCRTSTMPPRMCNPSSAEDSNSMYSTTVPDPHAPSCNRSVSFPLPNCVQPKLVLPWRMDMCRNTPEEPVGSSLLPYTSRSWPLRSTRPSMRSSPVPTPVVKKGAPKNERSRWRVLVWPAPHNASPPHWPVTSRPTDPSIGSPRNDI